MEKMRLCLGSFLMLAACGGAQDADFEPDTATTDDALWGSVNQIESRPFIPAVGQLLLKNINGGVVLKCTATVVRSNKLLTAAHCFCNSSITQGTIRFGDANGLTTGQPEFGFDSWTVHPQSSCSFGENSEVHDVAVITLPTPLVGVRSVPPFLGNPEINFMTFLNPPFWSVGYGNNVDAFTTSACVGCDIRRSGQLNTVRPERDPCNIPLESDCWNGVMWSAKAIEDGASVEISLGDGGGPLFFNVDSPFLTVAGVAATVTEDGDSTSRWAPGGENDDWLWSALEFPFTFTLAQARAARAVYARGTLRINDRARVVTNAAGTIGANVLAEGDVRIGVEAVVNNVNSRGAVELADRSRTGIVSARGNIFRAGTAITTGTIPGEFQKFEDFSLTSPAAAANMNLSVQNGQTVNLAAGVHGNVTVFGGGTLNLASGLHIFSRIQLESNSIMNVNTLSPTWLFLTTNGGLVFRGRVEGNASNLFVGAPSATSVTLGNGWNGTLVAPNAAVTADMVTGAVLRGQFFTRTFELHQGRFLFFVPFSRGWTPTCTSGFTQCS
jgi:hypothetical protein